MPLEDLVAAAGMAGVVAYGVLGGADFGGGIWDLFAAGERRAEQRQAIARAMGPVWEANHVWLIFVIVLLFTAFPAAFAALSVGMFGLFHWVLLGITLRGAAFVFRGHQSGYDGRSLWGTVFGVASVITPVLLGMAVGVVSAGGMRIRGGYVSVEGPSAWYALTPLLIGALALALCAYLAAVYLTNETKGELREDFRRRALLSGTVVAGLAIATLPALYWRTPRLWHELTGAKASAVLIPGLAAALLSWWSIVGRRYWLARVATIGQVALLLMGWGLAHYPFIIYPDMTLEGTAAPLATLKFLMYVIVIGLVLLLPSLWLLFRVFKAQGTKGG